MTKLPNPIADMHVVVDLAGERRAVTIAAELAGRLSAHLTGLALALEPLVPAYAMAAPIPTDFVVAVGEQAIADAAAAAAAFETAARDADVRFEARTLISIAGEGFMRAAGELRLSDLVVVGQDDPDRPEPMRSPLIESILFEAAAPALVIPYAGVSRLKTARAIVAWDGSAPAARAMRAAMPLLQLADEVKVVTVTEQEKRSAAALGVDIGAHLARHGLKVDVRRMDNSVGNIAACLLNYAADEGSDWMVMGAYGHSRMRELLLGGATRDILASMTLPVLMTH